MVKLRKFYDDNGPVFTYDKFDEFIQAVDECLPTKKNKPYIPFSAKRKGRETYYLADLPCAFDIETTSVRVENGEKRAWMYIWMFGICGVSIYGRTWAEFKDMITRLVDHYEFNQYNRLVCYVHNLPYEFNFMRKEFTWLDVFAGDERKIMYGVVEEGVEFRCSYILTGTSLAKVGEDLLRHKCSKLKGDLDYSLIRGTKTPITETELGYCINDIRVVMCKIMECLEDEKNIGQIPMTKTGYVRRDVRRRVFNDKKVKEYVQSLRIQSRDEYEMLKSAFQGGFTHTNCMYSSIPQFDVTSYDFTSSYPAVMVSEKFPMGQGKLVDPQTKEEFINYLNNYCCIFEIVMTDVKLKPGMGDCPIGKSKCMISKEVLKSEDTIIDNGRIRECPELLTTITDVDFTVYQKFYDFKYVIGKMYIYERGYLPRPIVQAVLDYYNDKTTLKDVPGRELDYMLGKANLNSIYGMMVMAIIHDLINYNSWTGWSKVKHIDDLEDEIEKYNSSKSRFTWYAWGIYITAYARRNLFTGIYECGQDYIYADTDSIKILNAENHIGYITEYNKLITDKINACLTYYDIDVNMACPKTIKGVSKPLGVWDYDGHYNEFKALRAKSYMVKYDKSKKYTLNGEEFETPYAITVAGVGKLPGLKYLSSFENPMEKFENGMEIPPEETGKMTHTYIDTEYTTTFIDYMGIENTETAPTCIHMESTGFSLSYTDDYEQLLEIIHLGDTEINVK